MLNTARVIQPKSVNMAKGGKQVSKDKICQDFKSNKCKSRSDHVIDGNIIKDARSYCFQEVGTFYAHILQDCFRRRSTDPTKEVQRKT